jgi:hypothetical protein
MRRITMVLGWFVVAGAVLNAQQPPAPVVQSTPKTKLEGFDATTGSVIIRGFSKIGTLRGQFGTSADIEVKEFTNAGTSKKEYGLTVQVKETSRLERENTSFIDYDEIDSLLKGIDYIGKIDSSATKFANFQADYRTKGDLEVSTFSTDSGVMLAIKSGRISATSAYLKLADLPTFRDLITKAKAAIDAVRVAG